MSKALSDQMIETTEVCRRHSGEWMSLSDGRIPADVRDAVADEIADQMSADMRREKRAAGVNDGSSGIVTVGGLQWVYDR